MILILPSEASDKGKHSQIFKLVRHKRLKNFKIAGRFGKSK